VLPTRIAEDSDRLRRFAQEARASAALEHPNIVAVHDIGTHETQPYIVSELLDGDPLNRRIDGRPMPVDDLLDMAMQIADGLDAAHARGIVHRDLKPANVFVTARGQVKILDFGLARVEGDPVGNPSGLTVAAPKAPVTSATDPGTAVGTVPYMSPEQARGEPVDTRSDLFSLGIVLYEMASGTRAFDGTAPAVIFDAILNRQVKPLGQVNPAVPPELQKIVDRCLQKRPEARYQQARDVLSDLRALRRLRDSRSSGSVAKAAPSIAVLPFADMSAQRDQEYFCEGMAEELINALAALPGIHVASRTSAFQFKGKSTDISEVGAKLRVEAVLEGSVRKAGNRLRIAVQLVNASDGYHIWAERYDRDADDVFAVQDEIARTIVQKLKVKLSGADADGPVVKHATNDLEAYHLYLQGRYYWARRGGFLEKAADCFARAIERDPSCAQAHAGLADAYGVLGIYGVLPPAEAAGKARPAAERALALQETLAEAHRSLAVLNVSFEWDLEGGEREYRRALELSPESGELRAMHAYCLTYMHQFEDALAEIVRAKELEPESVLVAGYNAVNLMFARRYLESLQECQRCMDLDPAYTTADWIRAQVHTLLHEHDEAIAAAERAVALTNRRSFYLSAYGMACAAAGRRDDADRVIQELLARARSEFVSPLWLADINTQLGERDLAFEWLERAYESRTQALISLGVSPLYDSLRADHRFQSLLDRIGVASVALQKLGIGDSGLGIRD